VNSRENFVFQDIWSRWVSNCRSRRAESNYI